MPLARLVVALSLVAACGDNRSEPALDAGPADAGIDAPDNPFADRFDGPEDFPRTGCRAGALAGFAENGLWPTLSVRIVGAPGALHVFMGGALSEEEVVPYVSADDLIVRRSEFVPGFGWIMQAVHVCDVPVPGVLRGHTASCFGDSCGGTFRFDAQPFHRLAGEGEGDGLTLVGELRLPQTSQLGSPINVRVAGDVAYVAVGTDGLRTVDLSDATRPALLGWHRPTADNFFNDVKLLTVGGRRYAVMAGSPSEILDVTSPATPQLAAQLPVPAHTVALEGTMAYLVDSATPTLWIYDLRDPRAPARRAQWEVHGLDPQASFHDLHVRDGVVYLSTPLHGVVIADVHDPAAPVELGRSPRDVDNRFWHSPWATDIGGRKVVLNGDEGPYPRFYILDADPASPTFLARLGDWSIPGPISMHNVMAIGDKVYMTHYHHGVRVLDASDPGAPRPIGYFNTWREATATAATYAGAIGLDLDPARRRIYVADTQRGLMILQATAALVP